MTYCLGMLGPVVVADFKEYLHPDYKFDQLPRGLGGTPVNILSRELLRRGRRLVIFTLDPDVQDEVVLEGDNLRICIGPFRPNRARDFFRLECAYLKRAIGRECPDILHAQWTYEYALAAQASKLPHVITAHDAPLHILRHNFIPYRLARTMMAYRVLSRASRVVSVSPYVADHLTRYMFYRGDKEIVPNGLPADLFDKSVQSTNNRADHPFTVFTILSNWSALKNGAAAIKAFNLLKRHVLNAQMVMFGTGYGPREAAEYWALAHADVDGIEFAGYKPHGEVMTRMAAEADVLLHPSLEESHGMPLSEAMAMGIPAIGGENSGGVPWVLDYGRAGVLVDVSSPSKMAEALRRFADSAEYRQEWGARGKTLTQERFSISAVADAYEKIYQELSSKK